MVDKGYTKAAYQKMGKLMPDEFQIADLGPHGNSGMLRRGIVYGIITKVRNGWYRVADGVKDPWKEYSEIATKIREAGNPTGRAGGPSRRERVLSINKDLPAHPPPLATSMGPRVSIASFSDQQDLIVIGKRIWLGVEVALVPKGGRHG
jgi:hypothetical protein